jgi:glycosyltransferase involved in cell wall biosynthesis
MTTDVALMVYSLGGGGVERTRVNLAEALQQRGYATAIVVARGDGPYRSSVPAGVALIDLGASSWRAWLASLTRYLRTEEPRILLAAMETAGVLALWARRRARVATRVVVSSHTTFSRHIKSEPKRLKRLVMPYLVRQIYRGANGVIAVSDGVADDLARFVRLPRERIQVIYNPIVTDGLLEAAKEQVTHPWLVEGRCPLILAAGRLREEKDFGTLLRSFALVRKFRTARLVILGEGEERPPLEALLRKLNLEDDVRMPGFVMNPFAYMARASVFVLSSVWEGLPGVVIQALACGCPVVSTDCRSGPREILENGRYGRLVPVGDHDAMARAILETLDHRLDANLLKARAMDFHVDKVVERYLQVMGLAR